MPESRSVIVHTAAGGLESEVLAAIGGHQPVAASIREDLGFEGFRCWHLELTGEGEAIAAALERLTARGFEVAPADEPVHAVRPATGGGGEEP